MDENEREQLREKLVKSQSAPNNSPDKLSDSEHWKIWDMLYGDMIKKAGS